MYTITEDEYNKEHQDFKGIWNTERYDLPNWEAERHLYMGKRTLLHNDNGATVLLIEGTSLRIVASPVVQIFDVHIKHKSEISSDEFYYKYIVTRGSGAHTAFRTKAGFAHFLKVTGLKLGKRRPYRSVKLLGNYQSVALWDYEVLEGLMQMWPSFPWMDNGQYTEAVSVPGPGGNVIYYMNCNCIRKVFKSQDVDQIIG